MKNKIKKFSKGNFQSVQPEIVFPETHLTMCISEGEIYEGSFTLLSHTNTDVNIRGLVYPSSFRVHCKEQGFEGNPVEIFFTYDGTGLPPGHVEQGSFTIVCNGGEFEIGFTAIIEKPFIMTTYGKVQNINDFKRLAFQNFTEAQRLFRSRDFYEILKYEEPRVYSLYDNMRKWSLGEQALEEFLVGIKQKERIFLTLSDEVHVFQHILEPTKEVLTLTKNTWGFIPVKIHVDGGFIEISHTEFTTEDFIGAVYELEYIIQEKKLHAGNNFGRIVIETPYEELSCVITVCQGSIKKYDETREPEFLMAQIAKKYLDYIAGRIDVNEWVETTSQRLELICEKQPKRQDILLMQAHVYLKGGREEEARYLLRDYNYNRFQIGKDPEESGYYLYLTALEEPGASTVTRVSEELNRLYIRNPKSWALLCMLINLDPRYRNYSERLRMLEKQFFNGARSVAFYVEAYLCFQEKNALLKRLGAFEIHVLNFASKYRLMTKEMALMTADLAGQEKDFEEHIFGILERLYKRYPDQAILTSMCKMLIKGNKEDPCYFKWYEKAVKAELKIAQLYEYYMITIDPEHVRSALPKAVFLYFLHGNTLNYRKRAFLYANLLTWQEQNQELAEAYREEIEEFTWDQFTKRHINESLRLLYKRFLTEKEISPGRMGALRDICYTYQVKTKVRNMKYVLVIEKDGSIRQRVPYTEEGAQVILYSKEARIVWESKDGRYYTDSIPYDTKRSFFELRYIDLCKSYHESEFRERRGLRLEELTFENIRLHGVEAFEERDVFRLCSKRIREENYEEDDFLSYICYELFEREQYDKVILTYLANFYCGPTLNMKKLWHVAREYEVHTHKLSERIITQMLFSEDMLGEEPVFVDYYQGGTYFRLKQAYLAYVSKEYVVRGRIVDKSIFDIITKEYVSENSELPADICKAALLKYYSGKEMPDILAPTLKTFLQDMCEQDMIFPFYLNYKESWLREMHLYDKVMIEYRAKKWGRVKLVYQLVKEGRETLDYTSEILSPVYDGVYVRQFILYKGERLKYYFEETAEDGKTITTDKRSCAFEREIEPVGRYGRLNAMIHLPEDELSQAMEKYRLEEELAKEVFVPY